MKIDRTPIIVATIAALSTIIVGYWHETPEPPHSSKTVNYIGRVTDAKSGLPIQGAKISFDFEDIPPIIYTDSEGIYRLTIIIKQDKINSRIKIDTEGYISYDRNIILLSNIPKIEDIRLKKK